MAFLAGVAAGVTVARLHPAPVIALMAAAWVIVALLEWVAWRDVPHYGRGLPPRYYVPQVALPPPRAVEQRSYHYPVPAEEEATWLAPAGDWGETLDWPAATVEETRVGDAAVTDPAEVEEEQPLPTALGDLTSERPQEAVGWDDSEVEPDESDESDVEDSALDGDLEPVPPLDPERRAPVAGLPVADYVGVELRAPERVERAALHHIDPPDSSARRRWFRRTADEDAIEVRDGPPPDRLLPGASRSEHTTAGL